VNHSGRILLISDDISNGRHYRGALEAVGYDVVHIHDYVNSLGSARQEPDLIVLCDLAVLAYPGQSAPIVRVPDTMTPDEVVDEVHRRISLRTAANATAQLT
jgi:CheY-like chemotaxis protein